MIEHVCAQGSIKWATLRIGRPTASRFHQIFQPVRRKPSESRHVYLLELLDEWMHGRAEERHENLWTARGRDMEALARFDYEMRYGVSVQQTGFVTRDDGLVGGSPDGLVGDDIVLEIKCSSPAIHEKQSWKANPEPRYIAQTQGLLYVTERSVAHLWLYSDTSEPVLRVIERDESYLSAFVPCLNAFIEDLEREKMIVALAHGREYSPSLSR